MLGGSADAGLVVEVCVTTKGTPRPARKIDAGAGRGGYLKSTTSPRLSSGVSQRASQLAMRTQPCDIV